MIDVMMTDTIESGEISYIDAWFANSKSGSVQDINELIRIKAVPIDSQDHLGNGAIHYAATAGHANVVDVLAKAGANLNLVNKVGDSALHKAAARGRLDSVKVLVANKADIEIRNKDGEKAIDLAKDSQIKDQLLPEEQFDDDEEEEEEKKDDYNSDDEGDDE
ncbi:hypothetical protein DFA_08322 [Cavenderia fasciculata]|uniref:Ankyrin repeat-containing protein n=1 Tax=Cavenderia fasciculata TaxID=261658 RepID=F4Q5R8_CACFS|nr:uncharacterized protein DFA_08322 [Cavenderia fasciculata]EGG17327.1 hypothetical protein DFA_08322 [Cavenderia fasciculata]|eukprot:XP_004355811.1 hypothetical protein DFA_08322 [Cavenderia fasciculata]